MTTMSTTPASSTTRSVRTGLAISVALGLASLLFVFMPTPDGEEGPPFLITLVGAMVGVTSIVCAVVAWSSGNRLAIRINAAALIINALLGLPAFFVDIDAWIKVGASVSVVATVVAIVLTLRREHTAYTVTD